MRRLALSRPAILNWRIEASNMSRARRSYGSDLTILALIALLVVGGIVLLSSLVAVQP